MCIICSWFFLLYEQVSLFTLLFLNMKDSTYASVIVLLFYWGGGGGV